MFNLRKDQDNARTLARAPRKGADLGGAFAKYTRGNVSSIKHSDLGMCDKCSPICIILYCLGLRFCAESLYSLGEETVRIILHISALYWSMLHKYAVVLVNVTCAN